MVSPPPKNVRGLILHYMMTMNNARTLQEARSKGDRMLLPAYRWGRIHRPIDCEWNNVHRIRKPGTIMDNSLVALA